MATIKNYTDIEQSKKLAGILPLESADSYYSWHDERYYIVNKDCPYPYSLKEEIPCWSLAALLQVLPNEISTGEEWYNKYQIDIRKYDGVDNTTWYQIAYDNNRGSSGSWHVIINTGERQNLIDCCVDMILLCKEHKWL